MSFSYYDNNNQVKNFSLKLDQKWNEKKVDSHFLNTIFNRIDNGDKKLSKEEFITLSKVADAISNIINKKNNNPDAQLLKELGNDKNMFAAVKISLGDFSVLDESVDITKVIQNYSDITGGKSISEEVLKECFSGKINTDQAEDRLYKVSLATYEYEDNYKNKNEMYEYFHNENIMNNYKTSQLSYLKDYFDKKERIEYEIKVNPNLRKNMDDFQEKFENKFGFKISDYGMLKASEYNFLSLDNLDFETFANRKDIGDIIYDIKRPSFNISEESLLKDAKFFDESFADRYTFDIKNSAIADQLEESKTMREIDNKNFKVEEAEPNIYKVTDRKSGEIRTIDLNILTKNLKPRQKNSFINSFRNLSNLMKWEFSQEINSKLRSDIHYDAAGQYYPETDELGVAYSTDSYTLSHEVIHAMMATVIDGKNTFNEEQNKKLLETFEKEKANFLKEEQLADPNGNEYSRYQYAAVNIHEFAAESGCLHLLGASTSQYTIAKYFPKSYELVIDMIENIRKQTDNKVLPKE